MLVDYLRQRSRPYLFSNTLPPAVVMGSMAAIDLVQNDTSFVERLRDNTRYFREQLTARGVRVREGITRSCRSSSATLRKRSRFRRSC